MTLPSPVPAGTEPGNEYDAATDALVQYLLREHRPDIMNQHCTCGWERHPSWPQHYQHQARVIAQHLAAAVVSSSPATPEGGAVCVTCGLIWRYPHIDHPFKPAPPPASPAETREGRERLIDAIEQAFSGDEYEENAAAAAGEGEWSWFRWLALSTVRAASLAVSLPGEAEESDEARCYGCGTRLFAGSRHFAGCPVTPSLPGEQPGGQG